MNGSFVDIIGKYSKKEWYVAIRRSHFGDPFPQAEYPLETGRHQMSQEERWDWASPSKHGHGVYNLLPYIINEDIEFTIVRAFMPLSIECNRYYAQEWCLLTMIHVK